MFTTQCDGKNVDCCGTNEIFIAFLFGGDNDEENFIMFAILELCVLTHMILAKA